MIELTPPDSMTTEERSDQISRILILACTRLKEKARRLKKSVPLISGNNPMRTNFVVPIPNEATVRAIRGSAASGRE